MAKKEGIKIGIVLTASPKYGIAYMYSSIDLCLTTFHYIDSIRLGYCPHEHLKNIIKNNIK
jgi:hypothetical protein